MAENSNIEWTDSTFNPWEGCQKVGRGCDHCYAENRNARFSGGVAVNWGPGAPRRRTSASNWAKPLQWQRWPFGQCPACGWRGEYRQAAHTADCPNCGNHGLTESRRRVFCASLADVFDNEVPDFWRDELMGLIASTPNLDWLLLTKRIGNVSKMIKPEAWQYLPHVWLGATVVTQEEADRDIPKLLAVPARVRFLSIEPMLGLIDLRRHLWKCCGNLIPGHGGDGWMQPPDPPECCGEPEPVGDLHWVICGGESGPRARPMHPQWARELREQCAAVGVPFLFKQNGEWLHNDQGADMLGTELSPMHQWGRPRTNDFSVRVGKKAAGRLLDGVEHNGFPEVVQS